MARTEKGGWGVSGLRFKLLKIRQKNPTSSTVYVKLTEVSCVKCFDDCVYIKKNIISLDHFRKENTTREHLSPNKR